jgi:hypothetical protein
VPTAVALSIAASCSSGVATPTAAVATFLTGCGPRVSRMRSVLLALTGFYLLTAVITTAAEAAGIGRQGGCQPDCWCKRPGLRLFRWVAPVAHCSVDPAEKQAKEQA